MKLRILSILLYVALGSTVFGEEPLRIVATGGRMGHDFYGPISSAVEFRHRTPHVLGGPVDEIQIGFMNWSHSYTAEVVSTNDITIEYAWLERESTGQVVPLTFSGNRQFVMSANSLDAYFPADVIDSSVWIGSSPSQDEVFWVNIKGSMPVGSIVYTGTPATWSGAKFITYDPANDPGTYDTTGSVPAISGSKSYYKGIPLVFAGRYSEPGHLSVIGIGDSIFQGTGDAENPVPVIAGFGFFNRAAVDENGTNAIAMFNLTRHGAASSCWDNPIRMPQFLPLANVVVEEFGTNDIGTNGSNANTETLKTRLAGIWTRARNAGVQYILRTQLMPRTGSTDSWSTKEGQSPNPGWGEGEARDIMNTYFDTALSTGVLDGVVKVLDTIADPTDTHCWLSNGTSKYVTGDGTHPNGAGYAKLAPVLRAELLALAADPSAPPVKPTGLTASASSTNQIDLLWSAAAGADSYIVKRGITSGSYTTIASNIPLTSYSDITLSITSTYYYVVSAVNTNGESADSVEASATTLAAPPTQDSLFFGNSFTMNNDVAGNFGLIAQADLGITPSIVTDLANGQDLDYHINEINTNPGNNLNNIAVGQTWNDVTLQGYSTESTAAMGDRTGFLSDVETLADLIFANTNSADATIIMYETWACPDIVSIAPCYDSLAAMQQDIREGYSQAAGVVAAKYGTNTVRIAPVGDAFEIAGFDASLYDSDNVSNTGSLLASLVIYRTAYDEYVSDIAYSNVSSWAGVGYDTWTNLTAIADATPISPVAEYTPPSTATPGTYTNAIYSNDFESYATNSSYSTFVTAYTLDRVAIYDDAFNNGVVNPFGSNNQYASSINGGGNIYYRPASFSAGTGLSTHSFDFYDPSAFTSSTSKTASFFGLGYNDLGANTYVGWSYKDGALSLGSQTVSVSGSLPTLSEDRIYTVYVLYNASGTDQTIGNTSTVLANGHVALYFYDYTTSSLIDAGQYSSSNVTAPNLFVMNRNYSSSDGIYYFDNFAQTDDLHTVVESASNPTPASLHFAYNNGAIAVSSGDLTEGSTHTLQMKTNLTDSAWIDVEVRSGVTSACWMMDLERDHAFFRIKSQ